MLYYFAAFEPVENGAFVVRVPDIPEVATQGADLTEAMDMARDAVALSLEAYAREKRPLPRPSTLDEAREKVRREDHELGWETPPDTLYQLVPAPDLDRTPVKVTLSMPRNVLDLLDRKAELAGMTRSGYVAHLASTL